jgi:esterase FrsA
MSYIFDADPRALIAERRAQFTALGVPAEVITAVDATVNSDLWGDAPGSWPHEWAAAAVSAEAGGRLLDASLCYGVGKYPCLGNEVHARLYREQLRTYLAASDSFPLPFERRILDIPFHGATTRVPVHVFTQPGRSTDVPVILMLGGVDTWKMDIHHSVLDAAAATGAHVVAVDGPGVGESTVASEPDASSILAEVAEQIRPLGNGKVGVIAWSFGATWSVKLALTGAVDAAVAIGAPVEGSFDVAHMSKWPNGMSGIMGNSLHRDGPFADDRELAVGMSPFSLSAQGLLGGWERSSTPLLVVNGTNDPYVPQQDVTLFENRPNTVARLVPDATHCAAEKSREINPWAFHWLEEQLTRA